MEARVTERTAELAEANQELELEIAELKRSQADLDRFFTFSLDLLCIAGFDGFFKRLNPAWEKTLGFTREEILARPWLDFVHPEDVEKTIAEAQKLMTGLPTVSFENRYRCRDGTYRWLLWTVTPAISGKLLYAAARDITSRKNTEEDLEKSVSLLAATLESTADGIVAIDRDGKITNWNRKFLEIWRIPEADSLPEDHRALVTCLTLRLKSSETRHGLEQLEGKPGTDCSGLIELRDGRVLESHSQPRLLGGKSVGWVVSYRDITERIEAERMKEEFVSVVSHELRTPLTSLRGFTELMLEREYHPDKQREFLSIIHDESVRLTELINDFLDIRRMESGRQTYQLERLDLRPLLREIATLHALDGGHDVRSDLTRRLPRVKADPRRVRQALSNLVSNAIKFSPNGGSITLGARRQGPEVVLSVSDEGIGIARESLPKLFSKFYRIESEETRSVGGTGLGLAIVRSIVEAHGGRVWVESEPGEGSTFFFTLPIAAPAPRRGRRPSGAKQIDVLLVEDDRIYARLLQELLERAGFSVASTPRAEEAIRLAKTSTPRLVLTDIQLAGDLDGWDLLMALKKDPASSSTPVIIISATETRVHGLALDGAECLLKPIAPEELLDAIRRQLPSLAEKRVMVVDDDGLFRREIVELLATERVQLEEVSNGREALSALAQTLPDLLILDLLMPEVDGFAVLRHLRADRRAVNLPVLVTTAMDLLPREETYIRRRIASLVSKKQGSPRRILRAVQQVMEHGGEGAES